MATIPEISFPVDHAVERSQVAVIIPTFNARKHWPALSHGLNLQGLNAAQVVIVDSGSEDGTAELARVEGYQVFQIEQRDFNHGGTRKLAVDLVPWATMVVYLTQDAVLATPDAVDVLVRVFEDEQVSAAYGRQLPRPGAGPIETHARLFNYPKLSEVRDFDSRKRLGIKATFLSNSFSAYRVSHLREVGGFPSDVIMAEDAMVAGKLLLAGWKTAYVAEAQVYHSHPLSIGKEFQRYFDIGVCHQREAWFRNRFGKASREGGRYVLSEISYLIRHSPHLLPVALLRTITKATGYQLGLHSYVLGDALSQRLSWHKRFWEESSRVDGTSEREPRNQKPPTSERIGLI